MNGWIPLEGNHPYEYDNGKHENEVYFLVCSPRDPHFALIAYLDEDGEKWISERFPDSFIDVTHWQPLPKPPASRKDAA
jgi:hypothetical protein